jgi:hypothetical protein
MANRSQRNPDTIPAPSGGRLDGLSFLIPKLAGSSDTLWSVVRAIAAENALRRRWPDDEIPWTVDQWARFMSAIEQTRGMAIDGDGDLMGLGHVLFGTWRKVRGYLEADLSADEIHRALRSDAEVVEMKARRVAEAQLAFPIRRASRVAET